MNRVYGLQQTCKVLDPRLSDAFQEVTFDFDAGNPLVQFSLIDGPPSMHC